MWRRHHGTFTAIRTPRASIGRPSRVSWCGPSEFLPDGQPIVFLHGYTDSWFSFSRLLPLLPTPYHAYAFDQRGHGDSERPDCCYEVADLVADVVAFLDAVGVDQATVVGHSEGSFTARGVVEAHPERVDRLVLIGSAVTPLKQETRELQAAVHTLEDPVPAEFAREFQAANIYVPLPEAFFERAVAESLKLPARVWQRALDGLLAVDDAGRPGEDRGADLAHLGRAGRILPP
jgi:non-heme chloroperoxidase